MLWSTHDLRPRREGITQKVQEFGFGGKVRVVGRSGDIKDMFTELTHDRLMRGIDVIVERARGRLRGKHLCVRSQGRAGVLIVSTSAHSE